MSLWESLKFGVHAISLERAAATKTRAEIEAIQRGRLEKLVEHARQHSDFYRERFAHVSGSDFDLLDLPTTNKKEIMENFDRVLTVDDLTRADVIEFFEDDGNLGKYFRDKYVLSHTSGSQGQPLLLVQTKDNIELLFALQASRGHHEQTSISEAAKRFFTPVRLAAVTLKPGFYPTGTAFEYMPESVQGYIDLLRLSVSDEDLVERLQEFRPTHLTAYGSILHELARHIEQGDLSLKPDLEQVVNISERIMPATREQYEEVFGAPVLNDYGMGECLFLSNGCSVSGGMHVNADWAILEVVDKDNHPVPDGTKGAKVLITNLANYVQPLIRYEIGDIVTMATEHCGCSNNLPLIERIDGRDSDMFYIETDARRRPLSPVIFELAVAQILDAREYQIVQEEPNQFRVLIEPLPGAEFNRDHADRVLRKQLADYKLDGQLKVELEVVERLAPDGDTKFKRIVSKVGELANKT